MRYQNQEPQVTCASSKCKSVFVVFAICMMGISSCRSIKPYEKEYLLNPTMDDARVETLSGPYGKSMRPYEKLAASAGGGGSTSCPTCGGK